MVRYVGGVEQRKKRQPTFCVSAKLWFHSDMYIYVPFSWTQKILRVEIWGLSGTLVKEQGCLYLASNYGAQRAVYRPKCNGTERTLTPSPIQSNFIRTERTLTPSPIQPKLSGPKGL